jgi:hypothetical protein
VRSGGNKPAGFQLVLLSGENITEKELTMKRSVILITAALFCLAISALAADQKQNAQPRPQQTEQTQMAQTGAEGSKDQASLAQNDCKVKPKKHSKQKQQRSEPQSEPQLWQTQVEYGGGG